MDDPIVHLPNEAHVQRRLAGAREQLGILQEALRQRRYVLAEAAANAITDQALKAVTASLHGFNLLLPQPLPAERVSWRNLRARFVAVQVESAVLNVVEEHLRPHTGWLWWLDRKEHASAFAPLLHLDTEQERIRLWRDPLDPTAGFEEEEPVAYFDTTLTRVEDLIGDITRLMRKDVEEYRRAARRQPGRMV